jgi:replicative DNA helicase
VNAVAKPGDAFAAEQAVIGGVLMRPDCFELAMLRREDFRDPRHGWIWDAIGALRDGGRAVDEVTVHSILEADGHGDAAKLAYLGELSLLVPTPAGVESYAAAVRAAALTRRLMESLGSILSRIRECELSGGEAISEVLAAVTSLDVNSSDGTITIRALMESTVREIERLSELKMAGKAVMTGYPTGIPRLDSELGGLQPGICTVVAARPRMGKSSFALGVADACSAAGVGVHVFSAEDSAFSYALRTITRFTGIETERIRSIDFRNGEPERMGAALRETAKRPRWRIDPTHGMTPDELVRAVRRHRRDNDTKVVVVDYINRLKLSGARERHDQIRIGFEALCNAAAQDGMAYVVLAQLGRGLESRDEKEPRLSDLKESGALEEYAKCVIALHREYVYDNEADPKICKVLVLKNSNGAEFSLDCHWDGPKMRISDPVEKREQPPHYAEAYDR